MAATMYISDMGSLALSMAQRLAAGTGLSTAGPGEGFALLTGLVFTGADESSIVGATLAVSFSLFGPATSDFRGAGEAARPLRRVLTTSVGAMTSSRWRVF